MININWFTKIKVDILAFKRRTEKIETVSTWILKLLKLNKF